MFLMIVTTVESALIHANAHSAAACCSLPHVLSSCIFFVINCFNVHHFLMLCFLLQTVKQEKTWCVRSESTELLQGLLAWVRAQWEAMFGVKLHTSLQDKAA